MNQYCDSLMISRASGQSELKVKKDIFFGRLKADSLGLVDLRDALAYCRSFQKVPEGRMILELAFRGGVNTIEIR